MDRTCRRCGCTDTTPCVDDGMACSWAGADLCSTCADKPPRTVVDAEIVDITLHADGTLGTRIKGRLDDGTEIEAEWPGTYTITTQEESIT